MSFQTIASDRPGLGGVDHVAAISVYQHHCSFNFVHDRVPHLDRFDEYISRLQRSRSLDELFSTVRDRIRHCGFDDFAYHVSWPPEGPRIPFVITTYPEEWAHRYADHGYVRIDPVLPAAVSSVIPFSWQELAPRSLDRAARLIFDEAGEFGLRCGATVPLHGPARCLATMSVTARLAPSRFAKLWEEQRYEVQLIALYAHQTLVSHVFATVGQSIIRLSPREREILLWAARGKTSWETSEILHLSHATVIGYVKTACKKLGVYSKVHAVVKAVMLGLIIPESENSPIDTSHTL